MGTTGTTLCAMIRPMASVLKWRKRWRVKWRDADGRSLYESYATKAEAEQAARAIEARTVLHGRPPIAPTTDALTLARWWDRWEPGRPWRPSTRATHGVHWSRYIKPVFGRMPLDQITTADVRRWHRKLEEKGLAPRTVGAVHRTLSMTLQGAVEDELLARNPARVARLPRPVESPPVALTAGQLDSLLTAIDATAPTLSAYARVLAATGVRRAEGAGLTWDRIDLDAGIMTIDRQLDYSATLPAWCPTKTSGRRNIPLTRSTVELLRAHRRAQSVVAIKDALVFIRGDGTAWPRTTLADAWRRARKYLADGDEEAGRDPSPLPDGARGWHTLRHTVASRLLEAGVPPAEAAAMLGHTPEQLLSTYAHVIDRQAADERLRAALDN
jgi:integrase